MQLEVVVVGVGVLLLRHLLVLLLLPQWVLTAQLVVMALTMIMLMWLLIWQLTQQRIGTRISTAAAKASRKPSAAAALPKAAAAAAGLVLTRQWVLTAAARPDLLWS
jgi:hypothetical protein